MAQVFSPINIGQFEVKNRLAYAPMDTHFATPDGYLTERQINYYVARARGGSDF